MTKRLLRKPQPSPYSPQLKPNTKLELSSERCRRLYVAAFDTLTTRRRDPGTTGFEAALAAKKLSAAEHATLNGEVQAVLTKGFSAHRSILEQARKLLATSKISGKGMRGIE